MNILNSKKVKVSIKYYLKWRRRIYLLPINYSAIAILVIYIVPSICERDVRAIRPRF